MDSLREFADAPMWTWVQAFTWSRTAIDYNLGAGYRLSPAPDPEQLRLLLHAALNRGVRGLLIYPHRSLLLRPRTCRSDGDLLPRDTSLQRPTRCGACSRRICRHRVRRSTRRHSTMKVRRLCRSCTTPATTTDGSMKASSRISASRFPGAARPCHRPLS